MLWEALVLVTILWLVQQWRMRRQTALAWKLKTNLTHYPILGHSCMFLGTDEDRMRAFEMFGRDALEAGGISKICQPSQLMICVADPAAAEVLLNHCLDKHELVDMIHFLTGNGSPFAPVRIWRRRRKILSQIFTPKNLNQFVEIFSKQSIILTDHIEKEAGKESFSIMDYSFTFMMDIIGETTLDFTINAQGIKSHPFMIAMDEMCQIAALRMCQPWFRSELMFKLMPCYSRAIKHRDTVHDFVTKIIEEKRKVIKEKKHYQKPIREANVKRPSFLEFQLAASDGDRKLNEKELHEEIVVLMLAGTDTTATTIAFTALMMSRHPDVQGNVYKEILEVFGDSNRPVTVEDLPRLKYLEAAIKETMRLYPAVPVNMRNCDKDVTLPSGLILVQGCGLVIHTWAINRNPDYWGQDADEFRPERFFDAPPTHPAAFVSFSYGPRGCLGNRFAMMLMKTVLSTLLRSYRLLTPQGVALKAPLRTKFDIIIRHIDKYQICLEHRIPSSL